ncbi:MAG: hypothetical protein A2Y53_07350 [Chloroflexi bacterium RBG_16_47_49]|nr:MAG: hypothetical protein A2Y53_07350 [Chloroflexi bacterium RBG_16_47_49]
MLNIFGLNRKHHSRDLLDIESILQASLKPISPRPEFIQSLQKGLMEYSFPQSESAEIDLNKALFFALVGFTGLVFIFSLWVRLIVVIISTLGMIQSSNQKR